MKSSSLDCAKQSVAAMPRPSTKVEVVFMSSAVKVQPCMGFGMRPGNEAGSEICQTLYHDRFEEAHRYPERYRDPVCSATAGAALRDFRGGGWMPSRPWCCASPPRTAPAAWLGHCRYRCPRVRAISPAFCAPWQCPVCGAWTLRRCLPIHWRRSLGGRSPAAADGPRCRSDEGGG